MEIGRINAIPPVPIVKSSQSAPDVAGVFAVEFRKQERQEGDVADEERAARGLEEEDDAEAAMDGGGRDKAPMAEDQAKGTISFFA